jgi:tryptophan-rich sensory protein
VNPRPINVNPLANEPVDYVGNIPRVNANANVRPMNVRPMNVRPINVNPLANESVDYVGNIPEPLPAPGQRQANNGIRPTNNTVTIITTQQKVIPNPIREGPTEHAVYVCEEPVKEKEVLRPPGEVREGVKQTTQVQSETTMVTSASFWMFLVLALLAILLIILIGWSGFRNGPNGNLINKNNNGNIGRDHFSLHRWTGLIVLIVAILLSAYIAYRSFIATNNNMGLQVGIVILYVLQLIFLVAWVGTLLRGRAVHGAIGIISLYIITLIVWVILAWQADASSSFLLVIALLIGFYLLFVNIELNKTRNRNT